MIDRGSRYDEAGTFLKMAITRCIMGLFGSWVRGEGTPIRDARFRGSISMGDIGNVRHIYRRVWNVESWIAGLTH